MKKERVEIKGLKLVKVFEFGTYFAHRYIPKYIYKFEDESGKVYVWKTTTYAGIESREVDPRDPELVRTVFDGIHKGDVVNVKATIKGESEYKGEHQTELERVKILEKTFRAETPEEKKARLEAEKEILKKEQRESLKEGDRVVRMTYKNYKEHYGDCETIIDSYYCDKEYNSRRPATIEVIIRAGRLKPSGVRGERFSGYEFENENGGTVCYRAVNAENAEKRVNKEFPEHNWKLSKIYDYRKTHKIW